jgi:uncharacterized membrane protein
MYGGSPLFREYNFIAGRNLDRLAALCDGVFAVAITLLVLDIKVPGELNEVSGFLWAPGVLEGEWNVLAMLGGDVGTHFVPYLMSFMTLGIFWVGQQTQFNYFSSTDRHLTWIHLAFLFVVSLLPFSTGLLAAHMQYQVSLVIYWLNLLLLGVVLYVSIFYARRNGLIKKNSEVELGFFKRRIVTAQVVYLLALPLSIVSTYLGVALIFCTQIVFVLGLRIRLPKPTGSIKQGSEEAGL